MRLPNWFTSPRTQTVLWLLGSILWALWSALDLSRGRLVTGIFEALAACASSAIAFGVYYYNIGKGYRESQERERRSIEEMREKFRI